MCSQGCLILFTGRLVHQGCNSTDAPRPPLDAPPGYATPHRMHTQWMHPTTLSPEDRWSTGGRYAFYFNAFLLVIIICLGGDMEVIVLVVPHYHPQTKLWEGNVFTNVCLIRRIQSYGSVQRNSHLTIFSPSHYGNDIVVECQCQLCAVILSNLSIGSQLRLSTKSSLGTARIMQATRSKTHSPLEQGCFHGDMEVIVLVVPHYHPQTKLWEGNVLTHVCLSTGGGGGLPSHNAMGQAKPPSIGRPSSVGRSLPPLDTTGYGQQADGTYPTGMHTYYFLAICWVKFLLYYWFILILPQQRTSWLSYQKHCTNWSAGPSESM